MSYKITSECCNCGACVSECPAKAVKVISEEMCEIDQTKCTECGICQFICPLEAIEDVEVIAPTKEKT